MKNLNLLKGNMPNSMMCRMCSIMCCRIFKIQYDHSKPDCLPDSPGER